MRKLIIHLAAWTAWTAWYSLNCLSVFGIMHKFTYAQWAQLAYNLVSLVIVFYLIAWMARQYFAKLSPVKLANLRGLPYAGYLLIRWQVLATLAVAALYVGVSVWLDNRFFGYEYSSLQAHIDQRFIREAAYIFAAIGYSYHRCMRRRQQERITRLQARVISLGHYRHEQIKTQRTYDELQRKINQLRK